MVWLTQHENRMVGPRESAIKSVAMQLFQQLPESKFLEF